MKFLKFAVIGCPVSHSLSPAMQNAALKHLGIDGKYEAIEVAKGKLDETLGGLHANGFRGVNITVPFKREALKLVDEISQAASTIGAVNTIIVRENGKLVGDNTDAYGFVKDLMEQGVQIEGRSAVVLGAGGSARAVCYGLLEKGCSKITVINRSSARAHQVASDMHDAFEGAMIQPLKFEDGSFDDLLDFDLIVNCTSLGLRNNDQEPWPSNVDFSKKQIVYDLIYNPSPTSFLAHAANCGAKAINGLGMLIHQGAKSFELWTGREAPVEVMRNALKK